MSVGIKQLYSHRPMHQEITSFDYLLLPILIIAQPKAKSTRAYLEFFLQEEYCSEHWAHGSGITSELNIEVVAAILRSLS
jgi:hypothetical protein